MSFKMTKHQKIIEYIKKLVPGTKISVRSIANNLTVSDGTAYRAIKQAENEGYVETKPKVGTFRVEFNKKKNIKKLTFRDIIKMVEGRVVSGHGGLDKPLGGFHVGAMSIEEMLKFISPGDLLIVGNRYDAIVAGLNNGCGILITGGFRCSDDLLELSDKVNLPIISSSYETYTTAYSINQAIENHLLTKEILHVRDIMNSNISIINYTHSIKEWKQTARRTGYGRFPVVKDNGELVGLIYSKDILVTPESGVKEKIVPQTISVSPNATVAYAARLLIVEELDMLPVVDSNILVGIITSADIVRAGHGVNRQPHVGDSLEDVILSGFKSHDSDNGMIFTGSLTQKAADQVGKIQWNITVAIISVLANISMRKKLGREVVIDTLTIYSLGMLESGEDLIITINITSHHQQSVKSEIKIKNNDDVLLAHALLSCKGMKY